MQTQARRLGYYQTKTKMHLQGRSLEFYSHVRRFADLKILTDLTRTKNNKLSYYGNIKCCRHNSTIDPE